MAATDKRAFWIIFFVVFIDLLGFGIVFPLLPMYTREFAMTEFQVGLVLGIYSLMQFLFAPLLGKLSDRIGRRPVLLVSMAGTALSFLLLAVSKNFWWFLIARALDGVAGSNISTAQAYIADLSPKEQRTRNLGMWIGAAFGLGFAIGPCFGGALHLLGQQFAPSIALCVPFLGAGLLALINLIFAFFYLKESLPERDSEHHIGSRTFSLTTLKTHLSHSVGSLMFSYAVVVLAFAQMEASISWISTDFFNMKTIHIYGLFAYLGLVMSLVQGGVVRRLAPKLGDKNMALLGCALMIVSLAAIPLFPHMAWLFVATGVMAAGESLAHPALISSISKGANEHIQGETMGAAQSLASLSRFLGPVLAGYLYQHLGAASPYFAASGIMMAAFGLCVLGYKRLMLRDESPAIEPIENKNPLSV